MRRISPSLLGAAALLGLLLLAGLLAPWLAPYDPNAIEISAQLQGPSWAHPLGTDALGRDMLSRALYGGRTSMLLALAATALSMGFGLVLGLLGGFFGGVPDGAITACANVVQGIPGTCLMVAIAGILGPGVPNLLLALFLTSWAGFSRIVRTETLRLREESALNHEFVTTLIEALLEGYEGPVPDAKERLSHALTIMLLNVAAAALMQEADALMAREVSPDESPVPRNHGSSPAKNKRKV